MDLKKFAIRGIIFLAVFVALCMFFSGTVRTITTPKVRLTSAKRGKLEERVDLTCKVAYPDVEKISLSPGDDMSLSIVKVNTREGYTVEEGEAVIEAKVANYDQLRKQYQEAYDGAAEQLMSLENKNRNTRINHRDEAYADAYYALRNARRAAVSAQLDMDAQLSREGKQRVDEGYPEGASEELIQLIDAWRDAVKAQAQAQSEMDEASRYTVDDAVWSYITEKHEQEEKQAEAEQNMEKLLALNNQVKNILAPHDGYIAEISAKEGDTYDGSQPLYTITAQGKKPVLRADISEISRTVTEGMTVMMNADSYDPIETKVVAVGTDADGKKYADIEMTKQLIKAKGSVFAMTQEDTTLTLIYRAREASYLLPTSAVRGSGDDRYVLVTEENTAAFGGGTLRVHKMSVKVLGEYGGTTSVQEDLSYYTVAYGEDRAIDDGDAVMEYLN